MDQRTLPKQGDPAFGQTIEDVLRHFAKDGYTKDFRIVSADRILCAACGTESAPASFHLDHVGRVEGTSDPADEEFVAALRCPACEAKGTLMSYYGPAVDPAEAEAVHALGGDDRPAYA